MNNIAQCLEGLEVGAPVEAENLAVFPLFGSGGLGPEYMLLEDALAAGLAAVEEKGNEGSVPLLVLINKSEMNVIVLQGDELVGGKQNRILNVSVLAPPKSVLDLPVSCVEQGRWHQVSKRFRTGEKAFYRLRHRLNKHVTTHRRASGRPLSDQADVWDGVEAELVAASAQSSTRAMHAAHESRRTTFEDLERRLSYVEGASGMACAVGGRLAFVEVFDRPAVCQRVWPRLVRSLASDAAPREYSYVPPSSESVRRILDGAGAASVEEYPSPGAGRDVRISSPQISGSGLVADGAVIHCSLFATD